MTISIESLQLKLEKLKASEGDFLSNTFPVLTRGGHELPEALYTHTVRRSGQIALLEELTTPVTRTEEE